MDKINKMLTFNAKASPLPSLSLGQEVWVKDKNQFGVVDKQLTPRSYVVNTPQGKYRRNRIQLNKIPSGDTIQPQQPAGQSNISSSPMTQKTPLSITSPAKIIPPPLQNKNIVSNSSSMKFTRSGRPIKVPFRFRNSSD